jgi:Na+/melibiose symporter-like transporter
MGVISTQAQTNAANSALDGATAIATSSFLEKHGGVFGSLLCVIYLGALGYASYCLHHTTDKKIVNYKKEIFIAIVIMALIAFGDIVYYLKNKDTPKDQNELNSTVGNISLIPFYLVIAAIAIVCMAGMKL